MSVNYRAVGQLSLRQLTYLLAVRDQLNFTRAAEQCFVTQSTLSGGLQELENTLGITLVERSRKHVAMTEAGLEIAKRAEVILALGADLLGVAKQQIDPAKGTLRLGVIPTIAPYWLKGFLTDIRQRFPGLILEIFERQTHVLLEQLNQGALDIGILALPMEVGNLHVQPLFSEELVLIAPDDDPLAHAKRPVSLQGAEASRIILLEHGHCLTDHALAACNASAQVNSRFEASNLSTMVQLVNAGLGLALLPQMAIDAGILYGSKTVQLSIAGNAPRREVAMVCRQTHPYLSFLTTKLFEFRGNNQSID